MGAGPGGYVAAIRAAQLGLTTVLIERDAVGGLCLNWGCIPSKALLHGADIINLFKVAPQFGIGYSDLRLDLSVAVERSREVVARVVGGVETLLRQNGVTVVRGSARITGVHSLNVYPTNETIHAQNIIVATGARPRSLPNVPIDGKRVLTSREALELRQLPSSIVIVGGGPIGVEFAYFYRSYGTNVTVVEALPRLLPNEDEDVSRQMERSLRAQGIDVRTNT
ncbi:MAG TPA: FAD-dependent oxidoreductase, partial [Dehalococcoidia bacterium]|nr:FAD-dependent oxidoreductase [Dehalococcoidia bacterium]